MRTEILPEEYESGTKWYIPPKFSRFTMFWIKFWLRVGWEQRAQWIILQHLEMEFLYGSGRKSPIGFLSK